MITRIRIGILVKKGCMDAGAVAEKYAWIKQQGNHFSVATMCRFMQVSRSAYYEWLHRALTQAEKEDAELTVLI